MPDVGNYGGGGGYAGQLQRAASLPSFADMVAVAIRQKRAREAAQGQNPNPGAAPADATGGPQTVSLPGEAPMQAQPVSGGPQVTGAQIGQPQMMPQRQVSVGQPQIMPQRQVSVGQPTVMPQQSGGPMSQGPTQQPMDRATLERMRAEGRIDPRLYQMMVQRMGG